jgi:hypothetical protein
MIKLLSEDEIGKQDDHRQQQGRQPEKMSQQIWALDQNQSYPWVDLSVQCCH